MTPLSGKVELEGKGFAGLMLALLQLNPQLVLTPDRTSWGLGASCVNISLLGATYNRLAFFVLWVFLDKQGNSDTDECLASLGVLLTLVASERIHVFAAYREFTGQAWFKGCRRAPPHLRDISTQQYPDRLERKDTLR